MDCIKTILGMVGMTLFFMLLCVLGAVLAPFAVIYLMVTEWRDVEEDDDEEMFNVR